MWLMHRLRGWTARRNGWSNGLDNWLMETGWWLVGVTGWWWLVDRTGWDNRLMDWLAATEVGTKKVTQNRDRVMVTWWVTLNSPKSLSWRRSSAAWRASKAGWLCHLRQVRFWGVTDFRYLILDLAGLFGVLFERVISCHKNIVFKRWFNRVYFFCVRY